jgi:hypothetical protein
MAEYVREVAEGVVVAVILAAIFGGVAIFFFPRVANTSSPSFSSSNTPHQASHRDPAMQCVKFKSLRYRLDPSALLPHIGP